VRIPRIFAENGERPIITMSRLNSRIVRPTPSQFRIKRAITFNRMLPEGKRREFPIPPLIVQGTPKAPWHSYGVCAGIWFYWWKHTIGPADDCLIRRNLMSLRPLQRFTCHAVVLTKAERFNVKKMGTHRLKKLKARRVPGQISTYQLATRNAAVTTIQR